MKISFIIPCYKSQDTIVAVTDEIIDVVSQSQIYDYEIVCVNDCSPDDVLSVLKELAHKNQKIKVINFTKNMNRPSAVMAGLKYSSGDYKIIMDDDGQCPMDRLWDLIKPLENGQDLSMAKYPMRKQGLFKNFGTGINKFMTRFFLDRPKDVEFTNFMAITKNVSDEIIKYDKPYPYLTGLLLRATQNITNVEMEQRDRFEGSTTFSFSKMVSLWMNGITAFSVKPLRISIIIGFVIAVAGFVYGLVQVILKLCGNDVPMGYSSLFAALLFIGGIILLVLGMIGEYIGRIYICINNSPQYVVKGTINIDE